MPSKKETSKNGPIQKNGKNGSNVQLQQKKSTVKYTFERTKEDIKKLNNLRKYLQETNFNKSFKSDSKIYRCLPDLYLNAVKQNQDLQKDLVKLTAKLEQLQDLKNSFRRIFKICNIKNNME